MDPTSVKRRLTCILAADAVGYSDQMGRDEEGTIRVLSAHRAVIDGIITFHQGRIVSTAGDSVLAEFGSVVEAVRCAVEIQEALKTRNDSLPEQRQMHFRVGVNLGDVVVKNEDLLGDGVNVAARLETMAEPGGICISSSVYDQITGKLDLGFQDIGEQNLKNISRPIHVYRVSGAAAPARPAPVARAAGRSPPDRKPLAWVMGAIAVAVLGASVAWQAGWMRSSATEATSKTTAAPAVERAAPPVDPNAIRAQAEADAQRLRSEAEALKRQAESELARVRADADAKQAAKAKADADSKAARVRADAEASAARAKSGPKDVDAKAREVASPAPVAVAADKSARPPPDSAGRFDGTWNVTIACKQHADGAAGYTLRFPAQVKDRFLRGAFGTEGAPGSLRLEGPIQPDGETSLDAKGFTGDAKFNPKGVQAGVPFGYQVTARFEDARGTGRASLARGCDVTFVKQ